MNQNEINDFFADNETVGIKSFKFEKALKPLDDVFDGFGEDEDNTNLKRFNELNSVDQHKVLNVEFISRKEDCESFYISVVKDSNTDKYVIFYNVYRKYFTNYSGFIEIDTDEDIATAIVTELFSSNMTQPDCDVVEEKTIYE
jgi:hypothetical protein